MEIKKIFVGIGLVVFIIVFFGFVVNTGYVAIKLEDKCNTLCNEKGDYISDEYKTTGFGLLSLNPKLVYCSCKPRDMVLVGD